jgi:hypothetical protein
VEKFEPPFLLSHCCAYSTRPLGTGRPLCMFGFVFARFDATSAPTSLIPIEIGVVLSSFRPRLFMAGVPDPVSRSIIGLTCSSMRFIASQAASRWRTRGPRVQPGTSSAGFVAGRRPSAILTFGEICFRPFSSDAPAGPRSPARIHHTPGSSSLWARSGGLPQDSQILLPPADSNSKTVRVTR